MPYRRLPKTDAARLKALKTVLDCNDIYTVRNRIVDWQVLNRCRPAYDRLLTACEQYRVCMMAQKRKTGQMEKLQRNAAMFLSHFIQVLFLAMERGEIKPRYKQLYGFAESDAAVPNLKSAESLLEWGQKVVDGERERLRGGGLPIYNPTIGKVATHIDIFRDAYNEQRLRQRHTAAALAAVQRLRPEVDAVLLDLWNQIEAYFASEPPEVRYAECRKLGVVYYYRRKEPHLY